MATHWPLYTWNAKAQRYQDARGRFVSGAAVRQALDDFADAAAVRIERDAQLLQAGLINLPEWQLRMEASLKQIHVASTAIAAGGWAQVTAAEWGVCAARIKAQYRFLERFARQIEDGLPLDGRFLVRAMSYVSAGSGTFEKVRRRIDLKARPVVLERRLLHSMSPCHSCAIYHAESWQRPGVLPDCGEDCECGMRCRCSFERITAAEARARGIALKAA